MVEQADILSKLKEGWGVASKLAGKGADGFSGILGGKHDDGSKQQSGLYWARGHWSADGGLEPEIEFFESQTSVSFAAGMVQRFTVSKAERLFMHACSCLITVDTEQALKDLQDAVQADTQFTDAYFLLGCILLEVGRFTDSASFFQKALLCQQGLGTKIKKYLPSFKMTMPLTPWSEIALFPDLLGVNVLLALAWRSSGNQPMASAVMEQIMSIMPSVPLAQFVTAIIDLEMGHNSKVAALFSDLNAESTMQAASLVLMAKACKAAGNIQSASEMLDRALARNDIDCVIRYDMLAAKEELLFGSSSAAAENRIKTDCPEYIPFFTRLGIKPGGAAVQAQSAAPGYPSQAYRPCTAPIQPAVPSCAAAVQQPVPGYSAPAAPQAQAYSASVPQTAAAPAYSAPRTASLAAAPAPAAPQTAALNAAHAAAIAGAAPPVPSAASQPAAAPVSEQDYIGIQLRAAALGAVYPLNKPSVYIGRDSGDIILNNDSSVSHIHAKIDRDAAGHSFLEDVHSTNGVWVNGVRMAAGARHKIRRGDVIRIGMTDFEAI